MSTLLEVMVHPTEKHTRFTRRCAHEKEVDTLADHLLICRDCTQEIPFTGGEQEWDACRGLSTIPSRCPVSCSECSQPSQTRSAQPVALVATMTQTIVNLDLSFDATLKQFSRKVQQAGILAEARRKQFKTPQSRHKRKAAAQSAQAQTCQLVALLP